MSIVCKKKSIIFANLFIFFWLYKNINHGFGAFTQHERTYYPFNNQTQVKAHWWFLEVGGLLLIRGLKALILHAPSRV